MRLPVRCKLLPRKVAITGDHRKQDQILRVKIPKYLVFRMYRRSYLICLPVVAAVTIRGGPSEKGRPRRSARGAWVDPRESVARFGRRGRRGRRGDRGRLPGLVTARVPDWSLPANTCASDSCYEIVCTRENSRICRRGKKNRPRTGAKSAY